MKKITPIIISLCLLTACSSGGEVSSVSSVTSSLSESSSKYIMSSSTVSDSSSSSEISTSSSEVDSSSSEVLNSSSQSSSAPAPKADVSPFADFKSKLDKAGIKYTEMQMGAELVGAEMGVKYTLETGGKIELYSFSKDSEAYKKLKETSAITLEGFGDFPVVVNGNLAMFATDVKEQEKIMNIFGVAPTKTSSSSLPPVSSSSSKIEPKPNSSSIASSSSIVSSSSSSKATESEKKITLKTGTSFKRNEKATVSIVGAPNTKYNITVYYSSGASKAEGLEEQTSDENGNVSWTWKIGGKTNLGKYNLTIVGNGETKKIEFEVID